MAPCFPVKLGGPLPKFKRACLANIVAGRAPVTAAPSCDVRTKPCLTGLSLEPLIGAIAAGNAVALKPSELSPCAARFLAENVGRYMDAAAVKVVQGGPDVGERLMEHHRWDKVLFTGSPRIGRAVMAAAARHLTPVALELGGKCPCIFDMMDSARELQIAVNRIIGAKWSSCAGQACLAIDYVLVEERFLPVLVSPFYSCINHQMGSRGVSRRFLFAFPEAQGAQVNAEEALLRRGPHGAHSERAPLREAEQPSQRQGRGAVRPARRFHGRQEPVSPQTLLSCAYLMRIF
jgi:hypothetical protein